MARTPLMIAALAVPLASFTAAAQEASPGVAALLPTDMTPWSMIQNAGTVVQLVMVGLALASVVTWTVGLAKAIELVLGGRAARAGLLALHAAGSLNDAAMRIGGARGACAAFVGAAAREVDASASLSAVAKEGVKERTAWKLERLAAGAARGMGRGTGALATIGATAPFVGLFGTVWGIMNAFVGIARSHTTNLAVVAPGIAEALLATAIGLVAAIPAVVIYNVFARAIAGEKALLSDAVAETMRLLSRDLDRAPQTRLLAAE